MRELQSELRQGFARWAASTGQAEVQLRHLREVSLQWRDNDVYGLVNQPGHCTCFDSAVNGWLIKKGLLTVGNCAVVALVVSSGCQYTAEVAFPDHVVCGLKFGRVGRTNVL